MLYFQFENCEQTEVSFFREMDCLLLFFEKIYSPINNRKICVAVSGGSDSLSLLILLKKWCEWKNLSEQKIRNKQKNQNDQQNWKLYCCTIDHGLRKESLDEALYVKNICKKLNIEHEILFWEHASTIEEGKIENLAREARYKLIQKFCEEKKIPLIAVGHNWNDQIETYELRKNAGSSEIGLAGMSQIKTLSERVKIIRPLLHFSKNFLEEFLRSHNIEWKTDPMNFQDTFRRVVARKKIKEYSPEKTDEISKIICDYGKNRYQIEKKSVEFLKSDCVLSELGFAEINKKEFLRLNSKIQIEVLRRLIWNVGMKKYPPSINEKILSNIMCSKINTFGKCFIKIKKEKIFIFREKRNFFKTNTNIWDNRFLIKLKLTKNQYIYSSEREFNVTIPYDILVGFPCLYEDGKAKYGFSEWMKFVKFIKKPDLLDVYCGVNCE